MSDNISVPEPVELTDTELDVVTGGSIGGTIQDILTGNPFPTTGTVGGPITYEIDLQEGYATLTNANTGREVSIYRR